MEFLEFPKPFYTNLLREYEGFFYSDSLAKLARNEPKFSENH